MQRLERLEELGQQRVITGVNASGPRLPAWFIEKPSMAPPSGLSPTTSVPVRHDSMRVRHADPRFPALKWRLQTPPDAARRGPESLLQPPGSVATIPGLDIGIREARPATGQPFHGLVVDRLIQQQASRTPAWAPLPAPHVFASHALCRVRLAVRLPLLQAGSLLESSERQRAFSKFAERGLRRTEYLRPSPQSEHGVEREAVVSGNPRPPTRRQSSRRATNPHRG